MKNKKKSLQALTNSSDCVKYINCARNKAHSVNFTSFVFCTVFDPQGHTIITQLKNEDKKI